jgi:hypothetical protein
MLRQAAASGGRQTVRTPGQASSLQATANPDELLRRTLI